MELQFDEDLQETNEQHEIHSRILEESCDIAEKLTELECMVMGIECYVVTMEGETECRTYTEEAQDIFNIHQEDHQTDLYSLLNRQLKIIK
jgi:hypothetical protein